MADGSFGEKIRLRFRKTGDLRLVSHHDLMRSVERLFRRADLPFRVTQGFHPTPRIVFALSLPLGVAGLNEVVEVELVTPHNSHEVLTRLNATSPAGLEFTSAKVVPLKASGVPRRVEYRLTIPDNRDVTEAVERFLAEEKVWVDKTHPRPRRVNVRPYVRGITFSRDAQRSADSNPRDVASPGGEPALGCASRLNDLIFDLWVTGQGTARAEELVRILGLSDILADGGYLERTELELRDETPAGQPDEPPDGPPETMALNHAVATVAASGEDDPAVDGPWAMPATGPVVE